MLDMPPATLEIYVLLGTNKLGIERITLDYIVSKPMGDNGI